MNQARLGLLCFGLIATAVAVVYKANEPGPKPFLPLTISLYHPSPPGRIWTVCTSNTRSEAVECGNVWTYRGEASPLQKMKLEQEKRVKRPKFRQQTALEPARLGKRVH